MFGAAGFGVLKAYAGLNAVGYSNSVHYGHTVHAFAGGADVVFFKDDLRDPTIPEPRMARFTFNVHGDVNAFASFGAKSEGGFFFRGGGQPCFAFPCIGHAKPWLGPYAQAQTVTIDIDYVRGYTLGTLFELDAAAMASSPGGAFDAEVTSNFDSTATLERIQIFEGSRDSLGPEITRFSVSSQSGTNYNQYLADTTPPSLAVPTSITQLATSSAGATVTFETTVSDDRDPEPAVNCAPPSGNRFSIGNTEVRCVATDAAGNVSSTSFSVNILGAPQQIVMLLELIRGMPVQDSLKTKLIGFLQDALRDPKSNLLICRALSALISFAQKQTNTAMAPDLRTQIVADATRIRAVLGCL